MNAERGHRKASQVLCGSTGLLREEWPCDRRGWVVGRRCRRLCIAAPSVQEHQCLHQSHCSPPWGGDLGCWFPVEPSAQHLGTVCSTFIQPSSPALGCCLVLGCSPTPEDPQPCPPACWAQPCLALGQMPRHERAFGKCSSPVTTFVTFLEQGTINCCSIAQVVQGWLLALPEKSFIFSCVSITAKEIYLSITSSWGLTYSFSMWSVLKTLHFGAQAFMWLLLQRDCDGPAELKEKKNLYLFQWLRFSYRQA